MAVPIIGDILDAADNILNKFIPDKGKKLEAKQELYRLLLQSDLAQLEVNKQEAAHKSIFVAGWRPFIGWTCGIAIFWAFIGQNIATWAVNLWTPGTPIPSIETNMLFELVFAMLGMGGLRTIEKLKNVAREK